MSRINRLRLRFADKEPAFFFRLPAGRPAIQRILVGSAGKSIVYWYHFLEMGRVADTPAVR